MKVAIVANSAWYLQNFRLALARHLKARGHDIVFIAPADGYEARLQEAGFGFAPWSLASAGVNPFTELGAVLSLRRMLKAQGAQAVLAYTPKGNIYSGLALKGRPCRFLPNISGLGRAFIAPGPLTALVTRLYKHALSGADRVLFQNEDDRQAFVTQFRIVPEALSMRLPGSGVDLQRFQPPARPVASGASRRFLFVGRLLRDKGVGEFIEAARRIHADRPDCEFVMLGSSRSSNPAAISAEQLRQWLAEGFVRHVEQLDDVRDELCQADCVVLPSYREGVPRSLLEAAAMARPVITTDAPGCRDTVLDGQTGLLCEVRSAVALEQAMRRLLAMPAARWQAMGLEARRFVEAHFSEQRVLDTYARLLEPRG